MNIVKAEGKMATIELNWSDHENMVDISAGLIEKYFPKGKCKERGAAMALMAEFMTVLEEGK